jgi:hypothetical protein
MYLFFSISVGSLWSIFKYPIVKEDKKSTGKLFSIFINLGLVLAAQKMQVYLWDNYLAFTLDLYPYMLDVFSFSPLCVHEYRTISCSRSLSLSEE